MHGMIAYQCSMLHLALYETVFPRFPVPVSSVRLLAPHLVAPSVHSTIPLFTTQKTLLCIGLLVFLFDVKKGEFLSPEAEHEGKTSEHTEPLMSHLSSATPSSSWSDTCLYLKISLYFIENGGCKARYLLPGTMGARLYWQLEPHPRIDRSGQKTRV